MKDKELKDIEALKNIEGGEQGAERALLRAKLEEVIRRLDTGTPIRHLARRRSDQSDVDDEIEKQFDNLPV